MSPAERFARLPDLLAADTDLRRRGGWLTADCRIDIGAEPFYLTLREGALADLARGPHLLRSVAFSISGTEEAWQRHWQPIPEPGWHDILHLPNAAPRRCRAICGPCCRTCSTSRTC